MQAFKLARMDGGKAMSFTASDMAVEYEMDKEVRPQVGALMCFDTLYNAKSFLSYNLAKHQGYTIYRCFVQQVHKDLIYVCWRSEEGMRRAFWKDPSALGPDRRSAPAGTVFCSSVSLVAPEFPFYWNGKGVRPPIFTEEEATGHGSVGRTFSPQMSLL